MRATSGTVITRIASGVAAESGASIWLAATSKQTRLFSIFLRGSAGRRHPDSELVCSRNWRRQEGGTGRWKRLGRAQRLETMRWRCV